MIVENYEEEYEQNNVLVHAGVKGMQWGVRKEQKQSKSRSTKQAKNMSSEQLIEAVKRMELERKYKILSDQKIKEGELPGIKFAKEVLYSSAKNVATQRATNVMNSYMDLGFQIAGLGSKK